MGRPSQDTGAYEHSFPDETLAAIKQAIYSGRKIEAIKLYREATGSQLDRHQNTIDLVNAVAAFDITGAIYDKVSCWMLNARCSVRRRDADHDLVRDAMRPHPYNRR